MLILRILPNVSRLEQPFGLQKQSGLSVTEYYNNLAEPRQEIDLYYDPKWECSSDSQKYNKMQEKERVFNFLQGLNSDLDEVQGCLLGIKPLLTLREAFAEVRREESRRRVMLVSAEPNTRSALAVTRKEENLRAKQWCEHCNKPYHTKSNCWKLHGKPPNWQPRNKKEKERPAYIATSMPAAASAPNNKRGMGLNLTADQVDFLQKLLNGAHIPKDLDGPVATTPAPSLAQRDKLVFSLTTRRINNSSWVVDTRASNHMIGSMTMFENFQLGNKDLTVLMADGTISSVKRKEKVCG